VANYGLEVLDVSNPACPIEAGAYPTVCDSYVQIQNFTLAGNYGYLATGEYGLDIFDVSQPEQPLRVGHLFTPEPINWVRVSGHTAFLAEGAQGLQIYDLSDPAHPFWVGGHKTQSDARRVDVADRYAFVLGSYPGPIEVYDVSTPDKPVRVGYSSNTNYDARAVQVIGNRVFVASGVDGLRILEMKPVHQFLAMPVVSGNSVVLCWAGGPGIKLQTTTSLTHPLWVDVPGAVGQSRLVLPLTPSAAFFRLVGP
jgi:hypothetical protein